MPRPGENLIGEKNPIRKHEYTANTVYEEIAEFYEVMRQVPAFNRDVPFRTFQTQLHRLLDEMYGHYVNRNDMGNYVPMTGEEQAKLLSLYDGCLQDFEALSSKLKKDPGFQKLQEILVRDRSALHGVSKEEILPPLAEVIHGSRISTFRLYDTDGEKVSANLSSRRVIEFTDPDGNVRQGFFTEDAAKPGLEQALKNVYRDFIFQYPKYRTQLEQSMTDGYYLELAGNGLNDFNSVLNYISREAFWALDSRSSDHQEFFGVFRNLSDKLAHVYNEYGMLEDSGIAETSKIARRAAAMTDVADALGFSNLLVRSQMVTVEQGGRQIEGVLMDPAGLDGEDSQKMSQRAPMSKASLEDFNQEPVLRSLADLQILDYLCGNTDRHSGNFFVRMDGSDTEHPKLLGVVGIDNDNSFGAIKEGGIFRLAAKDELKIMTPEMADAIKKINKKDLDILLKKYEFSKEEMNALGKRLDDLKDLVEKNDPAKKGAFDGTIKPGELHIVQKDEWEKLTLNKLQPSDEENEMGDKKRNIFRSASAYYEATTGKYMDADPKTIAYEKQDSSKEIKELRTVLEKEHKQIREIKQNLAAKGGRDAGGSRQFKKLCEALDWVDQRYTDVLAATKESTTLDPKTKDTLGKFFQDMEGKRGDIGFVTEAYIQKDFFHIRQQGKERIKAAKALQDFVSGGKVASQKTYELDLKEEKENQENPYDSPVYATNRMRSMMEDTLREQVITLKRNDPNRYLGIQAIDAQKRLWQYSQSGEKKPEEKEKLDFKELKQEQDRKMYSLKKDIDIILKFAAGQAKSFDKDEKFLENRLEEILDAFPNTKKEEEKEENLIEKNKAENKVKKDREERMTPKQIRSFLSALFEQETEIADQVRKEKAAEEAKEDNKNENRKEDEEKKRVGIKNKEEEKSIKEKSGQGLGEK